ncbi:MAG: AMP-binding protein [Betaproteobacteria bacterium]
MREPLAVLRLYPQHTGTLGSVLKSRAEVASEREFLLFQGTRFTYRQTLEQVERAAAMLHARGVRAGDRLGVMSANHPSTVFLLLALARLGAAMVAVNPAYGMAEVRYVLTHGEVCGVVCSPEALPTVQSAIDETRERPWVMLNSPAESSPGEAGLPVFSDAVRAAPAMAPETDIADAVCVFIYTSGTTGFPKGVMHSQRNLVMAGEGFVERMHLQPEDRLLCVLPMFHVNAICYSLCGALAAGATLILEPRFSASTFWQTVKETGATEVNTIAAANSILMRRPRSEYVPGHRLNKIYGAPFDAETFRVFQNEFSVPTLIEGYGMSEIPGVLNNPFKGPHRIGSMGMPSLHPDRSIPLSEIAVVDEEGHPVPDGQVGELVVRTPIVMKGYYRDPDQTAAAFRDGWFLTGDLGRRDAEGYFWFVARKKDIIRKRGENISGAELDAVVNSHPEVINSATIPVPSPLGEDDILVAVIRKPEAQLTAHDIADWCRARLAPFKVPRYVVFVDELPLTPTHRVAKFKLREDTSLLARAADLEDAQVLDGKDKG